MHLSTMEGSESTLILKAMVAGLKNIAENIRRLWMKRDKLIHVKMSENELNCLKYCSEYLDVSVSGIVRQSIKEYLRRKLSKSLKDAIWESFRIDLDAVKN